MDKTAISRIYVDHYLQMAILSRLSEADRALRFSELKEDGIENSLFMYHANKLIARHAITKNDEGFHLTSDGARWVNSVGRDSKNIQPSVKPLIQFIIRDGEGNLLLSRRKGQLKELLNDFMLPGGLHKNGLSADENALRLIVGILDGPPLVTRFLTLVESINVYEDSFVYHNLSHIYTVNAATLLTTLEDDRFEYTWMAIEDVNIKNPLFETSPSVPILIEKLENNTLESREVISVSYK